jgi:hypothetical protein
MPFGVVFPPWRHHSSRSVLTSLPCLPLPHIDNIVVGRLAGVGPCGERVDSSSLLLSSFALLLFADNQESMFLSVVCLGFVDLGGARAFVLLRDLAAVGSV